LSCDGRCLFFFFFQAEDGIRDFHVTGVQTCALPISLAVSSPGFKLLDRKRNFCTDKKISSRSRIAFSRASGASLKPVTVPPLGRSEERRVGKECRSRWAADAAKKKGRAAEVWGHGTV